MEFSADGGLAVSAQDLENSFIGIFGGKTKLPSAIYLCGGRKSTRRIFSVEVMPLENCSVHRPFCRLLAISPAKGREPSEDFARMSARRIELLGQPVVAFSSCMQFRPILTLFHGTSCRCRPRPNPFSMEH
jgi:hypothetical protein